MERKTFKKIPGTDGEKIILLDWDGAPPKFCNLLKIAADGSVIWTATPSHPLEGVWSEITFEDGKLKAYNFATGFLEVIDYDTGHVLERTFVK